MAKYFPNSELIIGKKYYEVSYQKRILDYETIGCDYSGEPYRVCAKIAKEKSLKYDAVDVVCYTATEQTSYHTLWFERYINGKKQERIEI